MWWLLISSPVKHNQIYLSVYMIDIFRIPDRKKKIYRSSSVGGIAEASPVITVHFVIDHPRKQGIIFALASVCWYKLQVKLTSFVDKDYPSLVRSGGKT